MYQFHIQPLTEINKDLKGYFKGFGESKRVFICNQNYINSFLVAGATICVSICPSFLVKVSMKPLLRPGWRGVQTLHACTEAWRNSRITVCTKVCAPQVLTKTLNFAWIKKYKTRRCPYFSILRGPRFLTISDFGTTSISGPYCLKF